jgi:quercetin dioxygenase-like cupin family protein
MKWKTSYRDHTGAREGKHFKSTLFQGDGMLLGLNCLEEGQVQRVHTHVDQDKFYMVLEGRGAFTVAEDEFEGATGDVIWAPAGVDHGVTNPGPERLVLLVGISPPPGGS